MPACDAAGRRLLTNGVGGIVNTAVSSIAEADWASRMASIVIIILYSVVIPLTLYVDL